MKDDVSNAAAAAVASDDEGKRSRFHNCLCASTDTCQKPGPSLKRKNLLAEMQRMSSLAFDRTSMEFSLDQ